MTGTFFHLVVFSAFIFSPLLFAMDRDSNECTIAIIWDSKGENSPLLGARVNSENAVPTEVNWSRLPEDILKRLAALVGDYRYDHINKEYFCCVPIDVKIPVKTFPMICRGYHQANTSGKKEIDVDFHNLPSEQEKRRKIANFLSQLQIPSISLTAAFSLFTGITDCLFISRYHNCNTQGNSMQFCSSQTAHSDLLHILQFVAGGGTIVCSGAMFANIFAMLKFVDRSGHARRSHKRYGPCAWCYGLTPAMIIFLGTTISVGLSCSNDLFQQYVGACIALGTYCGATPISFMFSWLASCCSSADCPSCDSDLGNDEDCTCYCPEEQN